MSSLAQRGIQTQFFIRKPLRCLKDQSRRHHGKCRVNRKWKYILTFPVLTIEFTGPEILCFLATNLWNCFRRWHIVTVSPCLSIFSSSRLEISDFSIKKTNKLYLIYTIHHPNAWSGLHVPFANRRWWRNGVRDVCCCHKTSLPPGPQPLHDHLVIKIH